MERERELPFDVSIEAVLEDILEYMEDRSDVEDNELSSGVRSNREMRFASELRQALFQFNPKPLDSTGMLRLCEASYKGYKDEKERNGVIIDNTWYDPFSAGYMNGFYEGKNRGKN